MEDQVFGAPSSADQEDRLPLPLSSENAETDLKILYFLGNDL